MKIKNPILASMLSKLGVEVKAELVIDDSNGTSLTFPDISDIAEIEIGTAVSAPEGTYVIADGDRTLTMVVLAGVIESIDIAEPAPIEVEASTEMVEVLAVLEAVVEANAKANASIVALRNDLKALKVSLKHEGTEAPAAAAETQKLKFKIVG